jgi:hypothetical protein
VKHYISNENGEPVHEPDLLKWGRWLVHAARHVAEEQVGPARVSTVFLGCDRQLGSGPPLLFETQVFWDGHALHYEMDRYATRAEAHAGHAALVERVKAALGDQQKG